MRPEQIALCYGSLVAYLAEWAFAFARTRASRGIS